MTLFMIKKLKKLHLMMVLVIREVIFDVLILYSLLNDRKLTFPNISKKYQNILWDLFKKVEDYENEIDTNPHLDIKEINYYIETELEDDN